jgi:formylglycine-generating enzyme required for sulfatase activity
MEGYEADSLKARALEAEQEARQKHATTRTEGEKPKPALEPAKPRKSRLFMMALAAYVLLVPVVWYVGLEVRKHWIGPEHPKITPEMLFPQAGQPWTNSLGLKFVPVAGTEVLFGVWDVRVKDFAGFARDTAGNGGWDYRKGQEPVILRSDGWKPRGWEYGWQNPGFPQSDECPVTCVSWEDAKAFCKWLTDKERSAGSLAANQSYRLPTDSEWSTAVGPQKFPWGDTMPPPDRAGNYAGSEAANTDWPADYSTLKGHHDAYARTSPVGSLLPNRFGLFDMGGNVWQWCEDWYRKEMNGAGAQGDGGGKRDRVLRGAAWSIYNPVNLSSGYRGREEPGGRSVENGFRCVLEMGGAAR